MRRALLALAVLAASGCDSDGVERFDGLITLSVVPVAEGEYGLRLEAVDNRDCDRELVVTSRSDGDRQRVEVEGLGAETFCRAVIPASAVVPLVRAGGGAVVEVRHHGSTDLYVLLDDVSGGPSLQTIRATTTRPAGESATARG
jgi:hypothetical protein